MNIEHDKALCTIPQRVCNIIKRLKTPEEVEQYFLGSDIWEQIRIFQNNYRQYPVHKEERLKRSITRRRNNTYQHSFYKKEDSDRGYHHRSIEKGWDNGCIFRNKLIKYDRTPYRHCKACQLVNYRMINPNQ
ncbi:MAG: hypothetical protein M3Z01_03000 [Thermoproteota archaeon]|nr:hypothetical protein [Thermoproteota archaeon]